MGNLLPGGSAPDEGTPEPDGDTTPDDGEAEQPTPQLWAGKYQTAEELEKAYSQLQSKLGEQGSELGHEIQQLREELNQVRYTQTQAQPAPQPAARLDEDTYEDLLDENPQQALAYAQQAGDGYRAAQALKAWFESDPYSATEWRIGQERQAQQAMMQQQFSGYQEHLQTQQLQQAFQNVTSRRPDLPALEAELAAAATENPEILTPLQTGTLESKERVIEALYALAVLKRGAVPPATGATPQEAPHVATTSTVPPGQPTSKNPMLEALAREAEGQVLPWNR